MKVLVAKNSLPTGTIFQKPEEVLEIREIAKATAPKNVLATFEEVRGRQLKIPRQAGHTITEDDLYSDKGNDLMALLPPGHRAVGIRVSAETVAAGFVALPHSRIDIACRLTNNEGQPATSIVLQNVLVLASGAATIRDEGGKPMPCDVVTAALTPEDAAKLEAVKGKGTINMYLRPFGDWGPARP